MDQGNSRNMVSEIVDRVLTGDDEMRGRMEGLCNRFVARIFQLKNLDILQEVKACSTLSAVQSTLALRNYADNDIEKIKIENAFLFLKGELNLADQEKKDVLISIELENHLSMGSGSDISNRPEFMKRLSDAANEILNRISNKEVRVGFVDQPAERSGQPGGRFL